MRHTPVIRMHTVRLGLALSIVSSLAALGLGSTAAWADGCTAPGGGPTGSDAPAFTYQCNGTYAGKWLSAYYVYDPATNTESPLYSVDYTYDCTNNAWFQSEWDYDTTSSGYIENWVPTTTTPSQPTNCPATDSPTASSTNSNVSVDNTTGSTAQSGDAAVTNNGTGGNATSGDGSVTVTQANLVNTTGGAVGSATIFNADIDGTNCGDPTCDFTLDPTNILPAGTSSNGTQPDTALCSTTDISLSNAITATAVSGNATVSGNGDAGNATSGNAQVVINLINIINSAVAAGQSFIGTINIYGDFNGNIYIPADVVNQLLGSNANVTSNTDESVVNTVNATATSGDAAVSGNGHAGSATTGSANTHITILNLTSSSIIGKNVLLVFINVLGNWLGMLMSAPAGATSAEFGSGIDSGAPSTSADNGAGFVHADANLSITNNVNATANSGDATVSDNGEAGSARSGDANIAVNILNVEDSVLSLANWFGVLFINVFGTWNGNFAILPTPAPFQVPTDSDNTPVSDGIASVADTVHLASAHFATFVSGAGSTSSTSEGAVLGSAVTDPNAKDLGKSLPAASAPHASYVLPVVGLGLAILLMLAAERERLSHLLSSK